jgi:hypothetical protein
MVLDLSLLLGLGFEVPLHMLRYLLSAIIPTLFTLLDSIFASFVMWLSPPFKLQPVHMLVVGEQAVQIMVQEVQGCLDVASKVDLELLLCCSGFVTQLCEC